MTKESLEQRYKEAHQAYEKQGLNALTDTQLKHLALYEVWSDGADWGTVIILQACTPTETTASKP